MSYILEALKKAQAERQLGSAPTIHAPAAVHAAPAAAARRKPLLIGVAAGAVVVAAAAVVAWRPQAGAPVVLASAPPPGGAGSAAPLPQEQSLATVTPVAPARTPLVPARTPVASAPVPASPAPTASAPAQPAQAAGGPRSVERTPATAHAGQALARRDDAMPAAATPVVEKPAAPAAEDNVRPLSELPEAIQREVPRVAFGGYIYSPNPADRLLLVDKALRHEGEEVAPGLVLEKLLPKAAVMNFRGYRYRVAY